jgi:heat shock protein HslJ
MIDAFALSALLLQAPDTPPRTTPLDAPPYEGEWIVEVIDNIKVMADSRVTMTIRGGSISGAGPCNTYRGTFSVTDKTVRIGQLLRTMKACDPPRMSEETDFFQLLAAVSDFDARTRNTLVLTTPSGKSITARRAPGPSSK